MRTQPRPRLFIGNFDTGIVYADRYSEENGDYKKIAILFYSDLRLEIDDPKSPLLEEVKAHAAQIQARKGEQYQISTSGQTITLGYSLKPNFHKYKKGDKVIWINAYGVNLGERTIYECTTATEEPAYYIIPTETPWTCVREKNLHPVKATPAGKKTRRTKR